MSSSRLLVEQTALCLMHYQLDESRARFLSDMDLTPHDLIELQRQFDTGAQAWYPSACAILTLINDELARRGYSIGAETMREVGNGE